MSAGDTLAPIEFTVVASDRPGLKLVDTIEDVAYQLETPTPPSPTPEPTPEAGFPAPVDTTTAIAPSRLTLPDVGSLGVRGDDGAFLQELDPEASARAVEGPAVLEPMLAPLKLYLKLPAGSTCTVKTTTSQTVLQDLNGDPVLVGVRSYHTQPADTITVPPTPAGAATALSTFGQALKTLSPDRTFPTLRGHPPLVDVDDDATVPDDLLHPQHAAFEFLPEHNVTLQLPLEFRYLYPAAPLAYFLYATIEPADRPALEVRGQSYPLGETQPFDEHVTALFQRLFTLEVATRATQLYDLPMATRTQLDSALATEDISVDWEYLYNAALPLRIDRYLDLPAQVVDEVVPEWPHTVSVPPSAGVLEYLPFLAYDLPAVQTILPAAQPSLTPAIETLESIAQTSTGTPTADVTQSVVDADIVAPPETAGRTHDWLGDGYPLGGSKPSVAARKQHAEASPRDTEGRFQIAVVLGEDAVNEDVVTEIYESREDDIFQFDVTTAVTPTTAELESLLNEEFAIFHYIGHIDDEGLHCADGVVDLEAAEGLACAVDVAILNGCRSVAQGAALVDGGCLAALVSLFDVADGAASTYGLTVARALMAGLPVQEAAALATEFTTIGQFYTVLGAPSYTPAPAGTAIPSRIDIAPSEAASEPGDAAATAIEITPYPTPTNHYGTTYSPYLASVENHYMVPAKIAAASVSRSELEEYLSLSMMPIAVEDALYWQPEAALDAAFSGDASSSGR